jgi:hypothetical protein
VEPAELIELSDTVSKLLDLKKSGSTQVTNGLGAWRCLIPGEGNSGHLFAGLLLKEPLEQNEIEIWTEALGRAISPGPQA